jgi:CDP-paratose 2-epimerase
MRIAIITGCLGLVGSEAAVFFSKKGFKIIGVDNDLRKYFFGKNASTRSKLQYLKKEIKNFEYNNFDIRNRNKLKNLFKKYKSKISCIIHCAAQPSHDWAAKDPFTDFSVNAEATLSLLEFNRIYSKKAVFIFTSTNKVYGDNVNFLPIIEKKKRYEIISSHKYFKNGINESMSIDNCKHSLFGASKLSADILVQEYGRYFKQNTVCFRAGCITGPLHTGTEQHGFLSYLIKCAIKKKKYTIFGYKGKQVRDNIHSYDLVNMFWNFYKKPRHGEIYNAGGGRDSNFSILESIDFIEKILGYEMQYKILKKNRLGDHIWWVSDSSKFKKHYPSWENKYNIKSIIKEIIKYYLQSER